MLLLFSSAQWGVTVGRVLWSLSFLWESHFYSPLWIAPGFTSCRMYLVQSLKQKLRDSRFWQNSPGWMLALVFLEFCVSHHLGNWHILYFYTSLMYTKYFLKMLSGIWVILFRWACQGIQSTTLLEKEFFTRYDFLL